MRIETLLELVAGTKVLVVGDVMLDHYIWGDASRISPEAPVPVVDVTRDTFAAGGAANVAVNLAALQACPVLAGWTGVDEGGENLDGLLARVGVERVDHFRRRASAPTIRKTRVMVRNQQLCRIDRENGPDSYEIRLESDFAAIEDAAVDVKGILISDYGKGSVTEELVERLLDLGKRKGIPVALDPKPRRQLRFKGVDLLTPNRSEALELAGFSPLMRGPFPAEEVCHRILERFEPRHLVVTLGPDGILLSEGGKVGRLIPTFARQVFDVSGAGDTVIASLLLGLSAGADLASAARLANLAAGVVVGKVGTAAVSTGEILDYLSRHPDLAESEGNTHSR